MLTVFNPPVSDIEILCTKCAELGYENNRDLQAMKYEWCLDNGGAWWAVYEEDYIVSVAGAHPFQGGYRFLFRGAQIKGNPGLSKTHRTSIPWATIMPEQISWASGVSTSETPAWITTNVSHDASGKMNRIHRVLKLLEKQGIVEYSDTCLVYGVEQTIWRLNIGAYYETLD